MKEMRKNVRKFIEIVNNSFKFDEPIVEIGSFQVEKQERIADLRPIFRDKKFIGTDIRMGKGVDRIEDCENLLFKDKSIGSILALETLEHVQNPIQALSEFYRVLKNEGTVVISSAMDFPIHEYPSDYWRFTPSAFSFLLKKFPIRIIGWQGVKEHPHTIFGIGIKSKNFEKYSKIFAHFNENMEKNGKQILLKPFHYKISETLSLLLNMGKRRFDIEFS